MLGEKRWHLCVGLLLLVLCSCRPSDPVPDQLIGTWQTSTASHAGSTMEITKQLVMFASNRGVDVTCRIVRFKTFVERSQTVYQLSYQDRYKHEYQLYLLYDPTDGTVKLRNQPHLTWKRMGA
jgi:hypothetical protein